VHWDPRRRLRHYGELDHQPGRRDDDGQHERDQHEPSHDPI
jgi:hypothetical protein